MPLSRTLIDHLLKEANDRHDDGISIHLNGGVVHFDKIRHIISEHDTGQGLYSPFEVTGYVANGGQYKDADFVQLFFYSHDVVAISRPVDKDRYKPR